MKQVNWYQIFGKSNIPDGRTVEPTDDIQIWLHCANIWDKSYTTLAEVLADTDTLLALISSNNAVDYMVRSTTWATQITVPTMTSNTTPEGLAFAYGELSSYEAYKAFDNNDSTFWQGRPAAINGTIGYCFDSPVNISRVKYRDRYGNKQVTISYSDNGTDYTVASDSATITSGDTDYYFDTNVTSNHRYWRANITASESSYFYVETLQFYSASIPTDATAMTYIGQNNYAANTLIADETWCEAICGSEYAKSVFNIYVPKMTDNTHPSGVASASSIYAGDVSNYGAWRAFDGNDVGGTPLASTQQTSHGWFQYQFTEPVVIKAVHYKGQDSLWASRNPSGYLQGSNDGVTFENIKAVNYRSAQIIDDAIENTNSYNRYRLYNSSSSSEYLTAATIQFYGRKDV